MIRWLCEKLGSVLPADIIVGDDGKTPYLIRHHIIHHNVAWLPCLYLHKICTEDPSPELHDHPWSWAFSLILAGGYIEERLVVGVVQTLLVLAGTVNIIRPSTMHRIAAPLGDAAWTLFVTGPRVCSWGFLNVATSVYLWAPQYFAGLRRNGLLRGKVRHGHV
jgi:hypothetical protein